MKTVCAIVTAALMLALAVRYICQIRARSIEPTLSTWVVFATGDTISFVSYVIEAHFDLLSGILNTIDVAVSLAITLAVALTGPRRFTLQPFEKKYLIASGAIVLYGVVFSDAWKSNLFSQALMTAGYIPLFTRMVRERRNTESFSAWGIALLASVVSMIPAFVHGNTLAGIYSLRSSLSSGVCLLVMAHFHFVHLRTQRDALARRPA
ncbi:hypothetical protein HZA85_02245 [Candidatus Uhrbacteria bacterium]|nr:hypothetical protein [Candidatus Uhrbacteria bacterium]